MPPRTDSFDLAQLGLSAGEARRLDLSVAIAPFVLGGEDYAVSPDLVPVRLDVSRTIGSGYALRLRLGAALEGPCMRCLDPAGPTFDVDAREVSQPGGGEELQSPYVGEGAELDVAGWARDALALALPATIACTEACRGLCPQCGANLNVEPEHAHAREPDARWAKLSELRFE